MHANDPIPRWHGVTYELDGDGRPLILLHGGMAPHEYWTPVVPHFSEYAVVVPQRPGFGTCLNDPGGTKPDEVLEREVEYVRTLVQTVDDDPILLGHSYGALTAIEAATDAEVKAVVAYESAVLPDDFQAEPISPTAWTILSRQANVVKR